MVPVLWMRKAKMKFYLTGIILLLGVTLAASDLNDNNNRSKNISFGFTGTAGINGLLPRKSDIKSDTLGLTAGGGLVFEKMFTNRLGFHSGAVYRYMESDFKDDATNLLDASWSFHTITIPFLMIISGNTESGSINLLAGVSYINIFDSTIKNRDPYTKSAKVLSEINPHQVAATVGINMKLQVTKFSDFFAGIIVDFHPTNLFRVDHGDKEYLHLYGARVMTGVMFRTDLFPIPKKIF